MITTASMVQLNTTWYNLKLSAHFEEDSLNVVRELVFQLECSTLKIGLRLVQDLRLHEVLNVQTAGEGCAHPSMRHRTNRCTICPEEALVSSSRARLSNVWLLYFLKIKRLKRLAGLWKTVVVGNGFTLIAQWCLGCWMDSWMRSDDDWFRWLDVE